MAFISVGYFRTLLEYTYWGRDRILAAAANISNEEFFAPRGLDHGGIHDTLVHSLAAEALWRQRWTGERSTKMLTAVEIPTLEALRTRGRDEEAAIRAFLDSRSDDELLRPIDYFTTSGVRHSEPLWQLITQLVNHGTQHRSEVALALTQTSSPSSERRQPSAPPGHRCRRLLLAVQLATHVGAAAP